MIQIKNNISIYQVMKIVDKKTNQEHYFKIDNNEEWTEIEKNEYNKIRGKEDEQ